MDGRLLKGASAGNKQVIRYQIMGSRKANMRREYCEVNYCSQKSKSLHMIHASEGGLWHSCYKQVISMLVIYRVSQGNSRKK